MSISAVWLVAAPAGAQQCSDGTYLDLDPATGSYRCIEGSGGGAGGDGDSGDEPNVVTVRVRLFAWLDDGSTCTAWRTVVVADDSTAEAVASAYNTRFFTTYDRFADPQTHVGDCPGEEGAASGITDADVIAVFVGQVARPQPRIAPGMMLTGLPAYLETQRPLHHDATISAGPVGARASLEVQGSATYMVDWGDGTTTGPHADPGGAYPDGEVTHIFIDVGAPTVRVTDTWTLRWRFEGGAWSSPLSVELAPVELPELPVHEWRSVRTGP